MKSILELVNKGVITASANFNGQTIESFCIVNKKHKGIATINIPYIDCTSRQWYEINSQGIDLRQYVQGAISIDIKLQNPFNGEVDGNYIISIKGFKDFKADCVGCYDKIYISGKPKDC